MQRRKYLAAVGSLAFGGAAVTGTGAFNSAYADRGVVINTATDENGYLRLKALNTSEGNEFVDQTGGPGGNDTITLTFDSTPSGGSGVNEKSRMYFDQLFSITNQGTERVWVWAEDDIGTNVAFFNSDEKEQITTTSNPQAVHEPWNSDRPVLQYVPTGQGFNVGMGVGTSGSNASLSGDVTIRAESDLSEIPGVVDTPNPSNLDIEQPGGTGVESP